MSDLRPDYSESLRFLRLIYPDGPWKLTAISVDKKSIDSRTFDPGDEADLLNWLKLHERRNLYYSVNPPIDSARDERKLDKSQVLRVHYLHVDVDPRVGEDVEEEQRRILRQFDEYRIPPSVLIFSGGGFNALWRLTEPVKIAEDAPDAKTVIARAVDVERRNWQFELDFSTPDHCRDVTRILRLPGTLNRPNADKIAKGRTISLARIERVTEETES